MVLHMQNLLSFPVKEKFGGWRDWNNMSHMIFLFRDVSLSALFSHVISIFNTLLKNIWHVEDLSPILFPLICTRVLLTDDCVGRSPMKRQGCHTTLILTRTSYTLVLHLTCIEPHIFFLLLFF